MKRAFSAGFAGLMTATLMSVSALAGPIAPGDVKISDGEIKTSLTGKPGSDVKGAEWFKNRKLGNCLACHVNSKMKGEQFHGEIGPSLDGVADRYSEAQLRAIVVNPKTALTDKTLMPAFYISHYNDPIKKFAGKPILTAEQVEDVVAYLKTLKE